MSGLIKLGMVEKVKVYMSTQCIEAIVAKLAAWATIFMAFWGWIGNNSDQLLALAAITSSIIATAAHLRDKRK